MVFTQNWQNNVFFELEVVSLTNVLFSSRIYTCYIFQSTHDTAPPVLKIQLYSPSIAKGSMLILVKGVMII